MKNNTKTEIVILTIRKQIKKIDQFTNWTHNNTFPYQEGNYCLKNNPKRTVLTIRGEINKIPTNNDIVVYGENKILEEVEKKNTLYQNSRMP